jgi:putative membrane protein
MLWVKALHIIFMVTWFAGLFYLPRLFVYHAQAEDRPSIERFKVMERKLFWGIMTPRRGAHHLFGVWLWLGWFRGASAWLPRQAGAGRAAGRLPPVVLAPARDFAADRNRRTHVWYRWFNEAPVLVLIATVILVVVKPF